MATVCIQCAIKAIIENAPTPFFDETPEEHQKRVHPDLAATQAERRELEKKLYYKVNQERTNYDSGGKS